MKLKAAYLFRTPLPVQEVDNLIIRVSRRGLFRKPTLPHGAMNQFVHDCRFALFRRRAVENLTGGKPV